VTWRRTSITLDLERELLGPGGVPERIRISARFDAEGGDPVPPTPEELREALDRLRTDLEGIAGSAPKVRGGTRPIEELVETYRPRQTELVELLREDGEISLPEAQLLHGYLAQIATAPAIDRPEAPGVPAPTDRPIAAVPLETDRSPTTPRPVVRLLEQYHIETLKQAGAVRARRQISFEEYMALKRHFSAAAPPDAARSTPEGGASEPHATGGG
jgi:hypothetical protein